MYVAAAIGVLALAPGLIGAIAATSASVLLECLPYLAASVLLAPILGRFAHAATAFAGCGCGRAPGALSLPAAVATAALFGPIVAIVRFIAALLAWRFAGRDDHDHASSLLDELQRLTPSAVLCGVIVTAIPAIHLASISPIVLFFGGAAFGALGAPCTLGGIALASALHAHAPLVSYGMLCTTGFPISFSRLRVASSPFFTALRSFIHACRFHWRAQHSFASIRLLSLALLIVVVIGAPQPSYRANETTLADLYPGERLSFTGVYSRGALVRYAITCCRADAAPVSIRLLNRQRVRDGEWVRAKGVIIRDGPRLELSPTTVISVAPPNDPFLYR